MQTFLLSSQAKGLINDNPADILENKEIEERLWHSLNTLKPEDKQILLLRDQQGLSYHEISEIMHIAEGTVKSKLARAREKLRKLMFAKLSEHTEDTNGE